MLITTSDSGIGAFGPLIMIRLFAEFMVVPFARLLALSSLVPLVNVIFLHYIAFAKWSGLGSGDMQGRLPDDH